MPQIVLRNKTPTLVVLISIVFGVCLPSWVFAQHTGIYVSADIGRGQNRSNAAADIVSGARLDKNATTSGFGLGWQFNKLFAVELGYVNFGKATVSGQGTLCGPGSVCALVVLPLSGELRVKAAHMSLVANAPLLENLSIYGRFGVARAEQSATLRNSSLSISSNKTKTDAIYGVGMGYSITRNVDITAEWKALGASKVDAFSAGARIRF